ncbi:hypothetical protein ASAP_2569 [Asaia bogorensis]|uniref:Uncharacterized protein n=1 Tax=Asaia bogorensis TaxID=91915 RepID=A0A060QHH2_9PROT|nr:hypothetical protein ASAP_2569 [Asaia bogorensis]
MPCQCVKRVVIREPDHSTVSWRDASGFAMTDAIGNAA